MIDFINSASRCHLGISETSGENQCGERGEGYTLTISLVSTQTPDSA